MNKGYISSTIYNAYVAALPKDAHGNPDWMQATGIELVDASGSPITAPSTSPTLKLAQVNQEMTMPPMNGQPGGVSLQGASNDFQPPTSFSVYGPTGGPMKFFPMAGLPASIPTGSQITVAWE